MIDPPSRVHPAADLAARGDNTVDALFATPLGVELANRGPTNRSAIRVLAHQLIRRGVGAD